jgi:acetyl esterase/lipase
MERRWRESGIPGFYVGRNGPVSRERARNVRALLYPKPKLPTGKLERFSIPGPNGPIAVEVIQPVEGTPIGTLVYYHGGGYVIGTSTAIKRTPFASPIDRALSSSTSTIDWRPSIHSRKV